MKATKDLVSGVTEAILTNENDLWNFERGMLLSSIMVSEFNVIGGQHIDNEPLLVNEKSYKLSLELLQEELDELKEAFENKDIVAQLDAMIDIYYVLLGVVGKSGLTSEFIDGFLEVHKNNMTKFPNGICTKNKNGKIIKPDCYKSIDLGEHFPHLKNVK